MVLQHIQRYITRNNLKGKLQHHHYKLYYYSVSPWWMIPQDSYYDQGYDILSEIIEVGCSILLVVQMVNHSRVY